VTVTTADMRQIPIPDNHLDVIVSNVAIHNLYKADERAAAVREIARVLKPDGACILADVRHEAEYTNILRTSGSPLTLTLPPSTEMWSFGLTLPYERPSTLSFPSTISMWVLPVLRCTSRESAKMLLGDTSS
jgi:ubiquinone/menaquinone biosynthesis C-methylase UbiE